MPPLKLKIELVAPPAMLLVTSNCLTKRLPAFNVSVPTPLTVPTATVPTLVSTPPFMTRLLLDDKPLPMVRLPANRSQVTSPLPLTVTVLLDEPLPITRPLLHTCALVTVMVLVAPPLPTVINPLETSTCVPAPPTV